METGESWGNLIGIALLAAGLVFAVLIITAFTVKGLWNRADEQTEYLESIAEKLFSVFVFLLASPAVVAFFWAGGIIVWQCGSWLVDGVWQSMSLVDVLYWLGLADRGPDGPFEGLIGLNKLAHWTPGLLALLVAGWLWAGFIAKLAANKEPRDHRRDLECED